MKQENNHSQKIWNLIGGFVNSWTIQNWTPFSDEVVNFTMNNGGFIGSVSIQEVKNNLSPYFGKFIVAYQDMTCKFPSVNFLQENQIVPFLSNLGKSTWEEGTSEQSEVRRQEERTKGERAPIELNQPQKAA